MSALVRGVTSGIRRPSRLVNSRLPAKFASPFTPGHSIEGSAATALPPPCKNITATGVYARAPSTAAVMGPSAMVTQTQVPQFGGSGASNGKTSSSSSWGEWLWKTASTAMAAVTTAAAAVASQPAAPDMKKTENDEGDGEERFVRKTEEIAGRPLLANATAEKGYRPYMEDEFFVSRDGSFSAVFDGHGGANVSKYLRENLYRHFMENLPAGKDGVFDLRTVERALREAYKTADDYVLNETPYADEGSCAVSVTVHCDRNGKASIVSCNVGDSRAVLSRSGRALDLTEDHKPDAPREMKRIRRHGGTVTCETFECPEGVEKVCRVNGDLAVARAIGDAHSRPWVSGEADIRTLEVDRETDEFIVLASDGLWDVMTSQQAVKFVHLVMGGVAGAEKELGSSGQTIRTMKMKRMKNMSQYLADEALRRGSMDNTTVAVVWLQ